MRRHKMSFRIGVLVAAWWCSTAVWAGVCPFPDADGRTAQLPQATLDRLIQSDCLGDPAEDDAAEVKAIDELLKPSNAQGQRLPTANAQTEAVGTLVERLRLGAVQAAQQGPHAAEWQAFEAELGAIARALLSFKPAATEAEYVQRVKVIIPVKWRVEALPEVQSVISVAQHSIQPRDVSVCQAGQPCPEMLSRIKMMRTIRLMQDLSKVLQAMSVDLHLQAAKLRVDRWETYRTQTVHQYIWEVWLNGLDMAQDEQLCPRDSQHVRVGFCQVPTRQWVVLHPDIGVRWRRQAHQTSELQPVVMLEVLGINTWDWKGEDSAEIRSQKGLSLLATYGDNMNARHWSFGPLVRYNGYNLALTKSPGDKWSVVVNINLAERYFGRVQPYTDYLRTGAQGGWSALLK